MYKIKQIPEDFVVKEIIGVPLVEQGQYRVYELKKRDYTTQKAVDIIQKALRIRDIKYAGLKDRHAITYQYISIPEKYRRIDKFEHQFIELKFKGFLDEPMSLGKNKGNLFEIVVRNIDATPKKITRFKNLYDEQRFSTNNFKAGLAIIKKDFNKAVEYISDNSVSRQLEDDQKNPLAAIRKLPIKIITLLVHSVQSQIFNEFLLSRDFDEDDEIPLVGFDFSPDEKYYSEIMPYLHKYNIAPRDFIVRSIPSATSETAHRKAYAKIEKLTINDLEADGLNEGKKKVKIKFALEKGAYATMAIKNMFNE
ncbi:tRNA pseudouridine(13) synthase TruD [Candidatus Woesearchaeota archaeon]|nr:tRNA pseudouridine(13) synthase TruD [Candidatus Woesearchaeota archaeon]